MSVLPFGHETRRFQLSGHRGRQLSREPLGGVMEPRKLLEEAVRALLKSRRFKKNGATWRAENPETILVLNIQKSQWGPQFYINCGVYFRKLGDEAAPPSHRCHIQTRLTSIVPDSPILTKALDFEFEISDQERMDVVLRCVKTAALFWLEARDSEAKARLAISQQGDSDALVMAAAKQHLGLDAA